MTETLLDRLARELETKISGRPIQDRRLRVREHRGARRPQHLATMIGNDRLRLRLTEKIRACKIRGAHPGHFLFSGPPGLGKTSLGNLVAIETGGELHKAIGSSLNSITVLAQLFDRLNPRRTDVIFIDEVHAVPPRMREILYTAMEDGEITIATGSGKKQRLRTIPLAPFVLVGATTMLGKLEDAFLTRFATHGVIEYATPDELATIATNHAATEEIELCPNAAAQLGRQSRGTPRVLLSLFLAAYDRATNRLGERNAPITAEDVEHAAELAEIDSIGLTRSDREVLTRLCVDHMGGPVGMTNLAQSAGIDNRTLDTAIEPYLMRAGLLRRTGAGRVATPKAYRHLDIKVPSTLETRADEEFYEFEDEFVA